MVLERFSREEEEEKGDKGSLVREPKRPRLWFNGAREVMETQSVQRYLEPFLRRVVQEEVHNALYRPDDPVPGKIHLKKMSSGLPVNQIQAAATRHYRLQFRCKLPDTLYTSSKIEAEVKLPIQIVMIDIHLGEIVTSGPLSCVKIEILVLDGDFGGAGQEEWTEEEFCENVVHEREGRRPLLIGELGITLINGVGYLSDVMFTDNSSWIRSRKFRLGARVSQSKGTVGRIQEAISEAFLVKDHRGKLYRKHYPPSLDDEVWRLENIGKDGTFHKRLTEGRIITVQDFLKAWAVDQAKLRDLLGTGMSNKIWETTLKHAKECDIGNKNYSYSAGQGVVLIFNSILQLVGAIIDQIYCSLDGFTPSQKVIVNKWKQICYENQNDIIELNEPLISGLLPPVDINPASVPGLLRSQLPGILATHLDEGAPQLFLHHQQRDPCNGPIENITQQRDIITVHDFHPSQCSASYQNNSFSDPVDMQLNDFQAGLSNSGLAGLMTPGEHLMGYDTRGNVLNSSVFPMGWNQAADVKTSGEHHLPHSSAEVSSGKWFKLVAVIKWMTNLKRLAAKRARIVHPSYPTLAPSMCSNARGGGW